MDPPIGFVCPFGLIGGIKLPEKKKKKRIAAPKNK